MGQTREVQMKTKPLDLAQFEGFTPGPWVAKQCGIYQDSPYRVDVPVHVASTGDDDYKGIGCEAQLANAILCAAAPALLAECHRLRAVNAELVAALQEIADISLTEYESAVLVLDVAVLSARAALAKVQHAA